VQLQRLLDMLVEAGRGLSTNAGSGPRACRSSLISVNGKPAVFVRLQRSRPLPRRVQVHAVAGLEPPGQPPRRSNEPVAFRNRPGTPQSPVSIGDHAPGRLVGPDGQPRRLGDGGLAFAGTAAASGTVGRTTDPIAAALACTLTKTMISPSAERHIQMSKQDIEATAIYFSAP
jgi:hypothetical protein